MRRPRLPRIRRSAAAETQPKPAAATQAAAARRFAGLRRRGTRDPSSSTRAGRLAHLTRRRARSAPSGAPGQPRPARRSLPQLSSLPLPASLRNPTAAALLLVIAVLVIVIVVTRLGSPGSVGISAAGAGDAPLIAGLPLLATKNTTRIAGADALAESAGVAVAVFPGSEQRANAVAVADVHDWHAALTASVLMSPPVRAPLILTDGQSMGSAGSAALSRIHPAQVIRVGRTASPSASHTVHLSGVNPAALAASVAAYATRARGSADNRVMVLSSDAPTYAMVAAGWAAKSGDPILFVTRDAVPPETRDAIGRLQQPRIYVIGPGSVIGRPAINALKKLGRVKRIAGADPVATAAAFARYQDGDFGWGPIRAGGGIVVANDRQPLAGAAAAALSASGTYGPLLLVDRSDGPLPAAIKQYLLDVEPGYKSDPAHGVYNHAWLIGDGSVISLATQTSIDKLLEIVPVQ